jgi:nucleotide-binding universal stress UspA family protein
MQKRILVPLDGSTLADRIVKQVKRLLVRKDLEVVLLSVVDAHPDPAARDRAITAARDHVEGVRDQLIDAGAIASTRVVVGEPVEQIVEHARRLEPELVAMATHGRSGLTRFLRGSTAEKVIRHCPRPVLVANPRALDAIGGGGDGELRFTRILVPLDGSDASLGIIPLVEDLARLYAAEVVLLRVEWTVPIAGTPYPAEVAALRPADEVAAGLEPTRRRLAHEGIPARTIAGYGPEALEILDAAEREQVDLVAMSTHGRSGLSRWFFGSVAEQVLRHCTRPLLVRRVHGGSEGRWTRSRARAEPAPARRAPTP